MRLVWPLIALVGCDYDYDHNTEVLGSQDVSAGEVSLHIDLELHGTHQPSSMTSGKQIKTTEAKDVWGYELRLKATKGGQPLPIRTLRTAGPTVGGSPVRTPEALKAAFATQGLETCPGAQGLAFRMPDHAWTLAWPIGDELLLQPTALLAPGCGTVAAALDHRAETLAADPASVTTCLALHRIGDGARAMACAAVAQNTDAFGYVEPAANGFTHEVAKDAQTSDRQLLLEAVQADPALREALLGVILRGEAASDDVMKRFPLLEMLGPQGQTELMATVTRECADPAQACTTAALALVADILRPNGVDAPPADSCAEGVALANTLWTRPDPDVHVKAHTVLRALSLCADAELLRPAMIKGLGSPTQAPGAGADSHCRASAGPPVGPVNEPTVCSSLPRLAGTWLSHHCDAAAIAAAQAQASAPRAAFDPAHDELLDGALRVLARCDAPAFDQAILPLPEKAPVGELILGQDKLRALYKDKGGPYL